MPPKKELSADAPPFAPASTPPNNDDTIPVNNDETIPVAPAAVEDQRAVVADKLRRLQHAQRAQLKAMLPKLPEGPAKLQLKKKIWAIEKELFPKEAAAPPPRRAIEAVAAEALPAPSSRATALLGKYSATAAARRASSDVDIVVPARRVQTEPPASAGTVKASASDILKRYSSSAAAKRQDEAPQYAAHGYCVLKGWLAADAVEALRDDLKSSRRAHGLDDAALEARDLNVDFIGLSVKDRLEAESTARTEAWAYRRLRRAATSREDGFVAERCVLGSLAAAAQQAAGFRRPHLLSEVFVVKPALSKTSFDWHRDDAKQLEKVGGIESAEAFCSTWAPLDDCTAASGTLELRSKKTGASQVIECEPGDVVVFAKDAWHRSSANASDGDRSVHYAQFSPTPVLLDARPLWFAVPCEPTRESVDETRSRADACTVMPRVVRNALSKPWALPDDALSIKCTVFRSPQGKFCLDGTRHPDALLTQSMASRGVVGDVLSSEVAAYAVLDDLGDGKALALPACPLPDLSGTRPPQFFIAHGKCETQLHRDAFANCYVCLHGERTWTVAHAAHGYLERAPGSVSGDDDGRVKKISVTLRAGDALVLPKDWWHSVVAADGAGGYSAAANFYFDEVEGEEPAAKRRKL